MTKEKKMGVNEFNSTYFLDNLKKDIAECYESGDTVDAFLRDEYGISNIMNYEFPDVKDKDEQDFSFQKVRGNTQLIQGRIITFKQVEALMDKVRNFDLTKLISLQP